MRIEYTWQEGDTPLDDIARTGWFLQQQQQRIQPAVRMFQRRYVVILLGVGLILLALAVLAAGHSLWWAVPLVWIALLVGVITLMLRPLIGLQNPPGPADHGLFIGKPVFWQLQEDGLVTGSEQGHTRYHWTHIAAVLFDDKNVYCGFRDHSMAAIPRAAFDDPIDVRRWIDFIEQHADLDEPGRPAQPQQ